MYLKINFTFHINFRLDRRNAPRVEHKSRKSKYVRIDFIRKDTKGSQNQSLLLYMSTGS